MRPKVSESLGDSRTRVIVDKVLKRAGKREREREGEGERGEREREVGGREREKMNVVFVYTVSYLEYNTAKGGKQKHTRGM